MYKSLKKNAIEPLALVLKAQKRGLKENQHDWLLLVRQRYQGVAIGWCCEGPLRLRLGLRLSQMMADDWVLPLVPLRLSVIILDKAMHKLLG